MAGMILVVEDDQDTKLFLRTLLTKNGYEVIEASDGREGKEKLRRHLPDLVCLDLAFPTKSGSDLYCEIKRDEQLSEIPIVVVSGFMSPGAGCRNFRELVSCSSVEEPDGYVEKPTNPKELLAAVEVALQS